MKRLTDRQVDRLARTLIYMWGTVAIWNGIETNGSQWDYCAGAVPEGRKWDAEAAARVEARMLALEPAFEARYRREGE
tara:strand:- start:856 stop:1089 length:234 start_codon:yes stop_codon:yes gene_type:complete